MPERLSIEGLRYAQAVAETGSFSAAARQRGDTARSVEWHLETREALGWTSFRPFVTKHRPHTDVGQRSFGAGIVAFVGLRAAFDGVRFRLTWSSWMRSSSCERSLKAPVVSKRTVLIGAGRGRNVRRRPHISSTVAICLETHSGVIYPALARWDHLTPRSSPPRQADPHRDIWPRMPDTRASKLVDLPPDQSLMAYCSTFVSLSKGVFL